MAVVSVCVFSIYHSNMLPVKREQEKLQTILVYIHQFECVCACVCVYAVFVIGFDVLAFLRGGEARCGVVIVTAVIVTALRAAGGAAGPHSHNVSSGRSQTSQHTCSTATSTEIDDCQFKGL